MAPGRLWAIHGPEQLDDLVVRTGTTSLRSTWDGNRQGAAAQPPRILRVLCYRERTRCIRIVRNAYRTATK